MKKGFTIKALLVLIVVIACFAAVAFPRYFWEKEKARALAMDAVLSDAEIAQDYFMRLNGHFSQDWAGLKRYFTVPAILNVTASEVEGSPAELYLAFIGPNGKPEADGYIISLQENLSQEAPFSLSARRIGGRFDYRLERPMLSGQTVCHGQDKKGKDFCSLLAPYLVREHIRFIQEPSSLPPESEGPRSSAEE